MKKSLHLITTLCFTILINCSCYKVADAQWVTIPDPNFVMWLNTHGFSSCMNGNQLNTTCSLVLNTTSLDCSLSFIYDLSGIKYFVSLTSLDCSANLLANLPVLPPNLSSLYCNGNSLSSLANLPNNLANLDCSYNNLSQLPFIPNVINLNANSNQITSIDSLSPSLVYFLCNSNLLTDLPVLPQSLGAMQVYNNQITSLPMLPNSMWDLTCANNLLSYLPPLPPYLVTLSCGGNYLTSTLPLLPKSLKYIYVANNNISVLPDIPDNLTLLDISDNPNLECLPKLGTIGNFKWNNTGLSCFPNYGTIASANPTLNLLPLCDIFNTNNCQFYWNISGKIFSDTISNCTYDLLEKTLSNLKLKLYKDTTLIQESFTIDNGNYSFDTDTGNFTFTVDTTDLPFYVSCPVSGFNNCFVPSNDSVVMDKNFGVVCKPGFDVGVNAVVIDSGNIRPANFARIHFYAGDLSNKYGLHCASGVSGTVQVVMSGDATYIGPAVNALTPTVNGDTLLYTIADFGNVNFYSDFGIIIQTDTTAQAGDQICFDVSFTPSNGDNVVTNNFLTHCFSIINSYDPNLKSVYPAEIIDDKNGKLTYTIQFQNTGTAPAQHIYIMDTLDTNLDLSSFELLAYSVQPVVQLIGNVARFNFPNINLPDSNSNEPASHGFVQFRIKLKNGLQLHSAISNTSYIYFDFNSPIQTNAVVDTLLDCNMVVSSFNISKTSYCKDDTLFANVSLNDDAIVNWYLDNVLIATDSIISIPNITLGNHILKTEVITYYCSKEFSTSIVFNNSPQVELGNDTSTCNIPITLYAGSGNASYQWSSGASTQTIVASSTNNYSVIVTDANECSNIDTISITINALPVVTLNAFPNSDTLCINSAIQTISSGSPMGGTFSGTGVNGNSFNPIQAASGWNEITYLFTDTNGCLNTATDSVFVDLCLGVNSISVNQTFNIYPNPTTGEATISYVLQSSSQIKIELYNYLGENIGVLKNEKQQAGNHQLKINLDIKNYSKGIYFVKMMVDGKVYLKKLVVE